MTLCKARKVQWRSRGEGSREGGRVHLSRKEKTFTWDEMNEVEETLSGGLLGRSFAPPPDGWMDTGESELDFSLEILTSLCLV